MAERRSIEVLELGHGRHPVVVIDGLSQEPEQWRTAASSADYRVLGDYYPGRRAQVPQAYLSQVGPVVGAVLREVYGIVGRMSVERALFSIVSTEPSELHLAQRIPHIDSAEAGRFAMVHYLSHADWGGTAFYRHRGSGYEAVDQSRHRAYLDRLESEFATMGEPKPAYIDGDTALFERIGHVPHRFNRALLYPSNLLHCSATGNATACPDDPRNGRLTVAAFLLAR